MPERQDRVLPRGPHRLTRDEVRASQRSRLLVAMTDAVAEKGYASLVVADVIERSGVSRATFYELFEDKSACFLAAFEMNADLVADVMAAGVADIATDASVAPIDRLARLLDLYLTSLAGAPALARVFLIEVYAAGPDAIARRRESLDRFVDLVALTHDGETGLLGTQPDQRLAAEFIVGAVSSLVTNLVGTGQIDELPAMGEALMEMARRILD